MEDEERKEKAAGMKEVSRIAVDFDALTGYKDEKGMPLLSMVRFYEESGVADAIRQFGSPISPIDNLYANFGTVQRIRETIKDNWSHYNVTIEEDLHPEWKKGKGHERRETAYKLNSKILNSINYDFGEYTPNIDDSLEDGIISFRVLEKGENGEE